MTRSATAFRGVLVALGGVAFSTGVATALRGTAIVRDAPPAHPNVESEHRFLGASWAALGATLWAVARRPEAHPAAVRGVAATVFLGGVARARAARDAGPPHPLYRALTGVELVLPPALVAWEAAVRGRDGRRPARAALRRR